MQMMGQSAARKAESGTSGMRKKRDGSEDSSQDVMGAGAGLDGHEDGEDPERNSMMESVGDALEVCQ